MQYARSELNSFHSYVGLGKTGYDHRFIFHMKDMLLQPIFKNEYIFLHKEFPYNISLSLVNFVIADG